MTHHAAKTSRLARIMAPLHSGPGILLSAALGLVVGSNWALHDLPEQFQAVYTSLYRMMALPFLALTIVYAIIRIRKDAGFSGGRTIALSLALAMVVCALIAIGVTGLICALADEAVARGIGPLVAAFDKADANFVEVTLAVPTGQDGPSLLGRVIGDFIPENIFAALANANIGQMVVFLILFSIAVLRILPQHGDAFLKLVEAARRPFEHLMEGMLVLVPVAVFFYAIHAAHAVSAKDLSALKLLFGVIAASSLVLCLVAILLVAVLARISPLQVAADLKASVLAGILAMTEEAALPAMIQRIKSRNSGAQEDEQEIVASLGLALGRFGMIALMASVLTYSLVLYDVPATVMQVGAVVVLSVVAAVLITGLNGPGVFAAGLAFCGTELGLPTEALVVLVIVLEPLLELFLIPVSVAVTHALVEVVTLHRGAGRPVAPVQASSGGMVP